MQRVHINATESDPHRSVDHHISERTMLSEIALMGGNQFPIVVDRETLDGPTAVTVNPNDVRTRHIRLVVEFQIRERQRLKRERSMIEPGRRDGASPQ